MASQTNTTYQNPSNSNSGLGTLSRANLRSMIEKQHGKIVSVNFVKHNGEQRRLLGRTGVTSVLKGGRNMVERDDRPYMTMFDISLGQYRTVNLNSVSSLRAGGKTFAVVD